MIEQPRGHWLWELAVIVGLCVAIKLYFRGATEVVSFDWLLRPTTLLVESVTGLEFIFDPRHGYTNFARRYVISPACAGVNFLVMSLFRKRRSRRKSACESPHCLGLWCLRRDR